MQAKSVITFYRLNTQEAQNFEWEEADRFVGQHYGGNAVCANVGYFDIEPEVLAASVPVWMSKDPDFCEMLEQESAVGANFFFVAPIVGKPLWGHAC